jgi:ABC-type sugar transport system ATPase subunit
MTQVITEPGATIIDGAPLLVVDGAARTFGTTQALRGVSLTVGRGEIVALVGENGAGKSTLVRCVAGAETLDEGTISLDGRDLAGVDIRHRRSSGISLAPQELILCDDLSVEENILLGDLPTNQLRLVDKGRMGRQATDRLAPLGLDGSLLPRRVGALTVATKAFVQIARALDPDTRLLIVDEPTAPMSADDVDRFLAVIRSIAETGVAIIYISHRLDEVMRIADRTVVLRDGSVVAELTAAETTPESLAEAMVGGADLSVQAYVPPDSGEPLVRTVGLAGGTVTDFDYSGRPGEITGIYGRLGSGREELAGLLASAERRSGGEVWLRDQLIAPGDLKAAIGAGLGYVPADRAARGLALELSIKANLVTASAAKLANHGWVDRAAELDVTKHWMAELDIAAPSPDTAVGALSGGNQQKVLIGRWLAAGSDILVLDEPTRGVDIATKARIHQLLQDQAAAGKHVIVISSDLEEVVDVATRVVVIRGGRNVAELTGATPSEIAALAIGSETEADDGH